MAACVHIYQVVVYTNLMTVYYVFISCLLTAALHEYCVGRDGCIGLFVTLLPVVMF